jgi:ABC-type antimicrobial peptide transport system permease subunit
MESVRDAVRAVSPQSVPDIESLDTLFSGMVAMRRFNMLLLSVFGLLAVVIATLGVYGVMAFLVAHRTQEFALRMALGADAPTLLRSVISQASRYLLAGLSLGFAGAFACASLVEAFLFRVRPHDLGVYTAAGGLLLAAGLIAAWIPARRAARVDPLVALRVS